VYNNIVEAIVISSFFWGLTAIAFILTTAIALVGALVLIFGSVVVTKMVRCWKCRKKVKNDNNTREK
jgi:hypothetical protein